MYKKGHVSFQFKSKESFKDMMRSIEGEMKEELGDKWESTYTYHSKEYCGEQWIIRINKPDWSARVYVRGLPFCEITILVDYGNANRATYKFWNVKGTYWVRYQGPLEHLFTESFLPKITPNYSSVRYVPAIITSPFKAKVVWNFDSIEALKMNLILTLNTYQ